MHSFMLVSPLISSVISARQPMPDASCGIMGSALKPRRGERATTTASTAWGSSTRAIPLGARRSMAPRNRELGGQGGWGGGGQH